jgi:hypothetical protein
MILRKRYGFGLFKTTTEEFELRLNRVKEVGKRDLIETLKNSF